MCPITFIRPYTAGSLKKKRLYIRVFFIICREALNGFPSLSQNGRREPK